MKKIHFFTAILFISLVFIPNTYAHKVQMFAYPEGDTVFVEGYFADGKRPKKSEVLVYDTEGKVLFSGVTDDEGKLSFKIPRKTDLRITLNAGMGHKAEYTLPASELGSTEPKVTANPPLSPFKKGGDKRAAVDEGASSEKGQVSQVSQLDEAQIQAIVEKAVEKAVGEAIKPLVRSFTEMTQKNSLTTIIGGIGYILGLMGIALYFKSRKGS